MNKRRTIKKRDLNKIRRALPTGWRSELSLQSDLSESLVEKVMLGIRNNELIVQLAIELSFLKPEDKVSMIEKINPSAKLVLQND